MTQAWERQDGESDDAFKAFTNYRDMPRPRRVLSAMYGIPSATLSEWSTTHAWGSRVTQFDDYLSAVAVGEQESLIRQGVEEIVGQHLALLQNLREFTARETGKWLEVSRSLAGPSLVKVGELVKLGEMVVKLDRLVHEQSTENIQESFDDLSALTPEELRTLLELQRKATLGD